MSPRILLISALLTCLIPITTHAAYSDGTIKIGVLTDLSGTYANLAGPGSVAAARMAVEDFEADKKGIKVEVISADHQNKVDVGTAIVNKWYDQEKVDVVVDVPSSAVALAVNQITREKNKALLVSGAGSSDLTGKACSPNTIHWSYDTWALANSTGTVIVRTGGKSWTFLTADYAFGQALQRDTAAAIMRAGGNVVENIVHPFPAPDMSPYLKQAKRSGARIIGLANAGNDTINAITKGADLGINQGGTQFAGLLIFITDVHSIGLEKAQGLLLTSSFYWDLNPKSRLWSTRFFERQKQMPTMVQAGVYASVLHYLKAATALQSDDGARVIAKMKEMQTNDAPFGYGHIRRDGRKIHNMYLFQVKKPAESKKPWDYYKVLGTIPADSAFRPLKDGECPLVK